MRSVAGDEPRCRHGMATCYRCGLGGTITDEQQRRDEKNRQRSHDEPIVLKRREEMPSCIHRSEYVGVLNCGCAGARKVYRCSQLIRPNISPPEQAFCIQRTTSKPYSQIIDPTTKATLYSVDARELVICRPVRNGIGCELFQSMATE